ncbi:BPSS1187 family protein, partial [Pyxidicoccus sp. 3LG]
ICRLVTPAEAGTPGSGRYPEPHVVLRPRLPTKAELVVFLPGTGGWPEAYLDGLHLDSEHNLYASATSRGYRAIGLTYQNQPSIGQLCGASDACFLPTRRTLITGDVQPGSAVTSLSREDAILPRLTRLLVYLRDTADPTGGWGGFFLNPACTTACILNPSKLIFAGHSQGGGHAGVIGRDYGVRRVVMLASPCDALAGVGPIASWSLPPLATPPGASTYRGLVARGRTSSGYTVDACDADAVRHWAPERMNAQWSRLTSATGLCPTEPHACVARDAQFFTEWQNLWP